MERLPTSVRPCYVMRLARPKLRCRSSSTAMEGGGAGGRVDRELTVRQGEEEEEEQ